MKTWQWIVLLVVVAGAAFVLGKFWSALVGAYQNKDRISGALDIIGGVEKIIG